MKKKIIDPYIDNRYFILKNKLGITNGEKLKKAESDFVTDRIAEILRNMHFEPLLKLHKYMFSDVYDFAGYYRVIHIEKPESVLHGWSVEYAEPENISKEVEDIFKTIRETDFYSLNNDEKIDYVTKTLVELWKTHPFREGNTRTSLVFLRCFLKSYGIEFDTNLFKNQKTYEYTRDALVAASFESKDFNVERNYAYIRRLISDIMKDSLENNKKKQ